LTQMIATEGLSVIEAIDWVGDAKLSASARGRGRGDSEDDLRSTASQCIAARSVARYVLGIPVEQKGN